VISAAASLIFDDDGRVLLMREGYGEGRYGLPGGVIEDGETPRAATIREVEEELGLQVDAKELVAVYHLRTLRSEGFRFFFRCEIVRGQPTIRGTGEVSEFVWASPDQLPLPLTTTAPLAIADAAAVGIGVYREVDVRPKD
jgi:8-oxo-dGTP pyrophosphatase MutT (NUDIX family)